MRQKKLQKIISTCFSVNPNFVADLNIQDSRCNDFGSTFSICLIYQQLKLLNGMQNYRMFYCYTLTNSFSSLEICAGLIIPIASCCILFVCLFGICCCWLDGDGLGLVEICVGVFVCGLLVIVIEELICLFPRPAGRPLPGLLVMVVVLALLMSLVGASKSTAMMSFTELMMSFLIGCSCLTDRINCFSMWRLGWDGMG